MHIYQISNNITAHLTPSSWVISEAVNCSTSIERRVATRNQSLFLNLIWLLEIGYYCKKKKQVCSLHTSLSTLAQVLSARSWRAAGSSLHSKVFQHSQQHRFFKHLHTARWKSVQLFAKVWINTAEFKSGCCRWRLPFRVVSSETDIIDRYVVSVRIVVGMIMKIWCIICNEWTANRVRAKLFHPSDEHVTTVTRSCFRLSRCPNW